MTKQFVDSLISDMKKAGVVTKAAPWMVEGLGDRALNVRYIGMKLTGDWAEIMSTRNNLLLKFITSRADSYVEFYLANKTPFTKIITRTFKKDDKWETIIGEVKRRLKKDKTDYLNHTTQVGNIFERIKSQLL